MTRKPPPTVIADGPDGATETQIADLPDAALAALAGSGQRDAIREYWQRKARPGWLTTASARIRGQRGLGGGRA